MLAQQLSVLYMWSVKTGVIPLLQVNQVLDIKFKTFIRMVACFPEKVTNFDFTNTMSGLEYSEKVSFKL